MAEVEEREEGTTAKQRTPALHERTWFHGLLFIISFVTALLSQRGENSWFAACQFAGTLLLILAAHEMGHYLTARYYGVAQSLPYFIPAPNHFGTLGAVIIMRSQPPNRSILLRIAAIGPLTGLLVAIPCAIYGLQLSWPAQSLGPASHYLFGESILFALLEHWFAPMEGDLVLHPIAFAAWVGFFVTSINLIPVGQLDGGHMAYALLPQAHRWLSRAMVLALLGLGGTAWYLAEIGTQPGLLGGATWLIWAMVMLLTGLSHPQVQHPSHNLKPIDWCLGASCGLLFALTFVPIPIQLQAFDSPWPLGEPEGLQRFFDHGPRDLPPPTNEGLQPAERGPLAPTDIQL